MNFAKFLRTTFLQNTSERLLLNGANLANTDIVALINYPIGSLFVQVNVGLGGKIISLLIPTVHN